MKFNWKVTVQTDWYNTDHFFVDAENIGGAYRKAEKSRHSATVIIEITLADGKQNQDKVREILLKQVEA